jgi:hypothetical protein
LFRTNHHHFAAHQIAKGEGKMSAAATVVVVLVALVVVGGVAWYFLGQRRRTEALQARYGPEYSRTVSETGDQRKAEEELVKRKERIDQLQIQPLRAEQREQFLTRWRSVQAMFVDDPAGAIARADSLVAEVMATRGYPVSDFEQRAADISVHHAVVVDNYRAACEIVARQRQNAATTEDLRKAMVHYRALFEDLLEDREHGADRPVERQVERSVEREADRATAPASATQPPLRTDRDLRP